MFMCEIPNTEVRPLRADGAALESRPPRDNFKQKPARSFQTLGGLLFFPVLLQNTSRLCDDSQNSEVPTRRAMRQMLGLFMLTIMLGGAGCDGAPPANATSNAGGAAAANKTPGANANSTAGPVPVYGYEVVNTFPHDAAAFTQGLVFHEGALLESTGQYGESTLRRVEVKTGKVLEQVGVGERFFAEGLTLLNGK